MLLKQQPLTCPGLLTPCVAAVLPRQLVHREKWRHVLAVGYSVVKRKRRRPQEHRQCSVSGFAVPHWRQTAFCCPVWLLGSSASAIYGWCRHVAELSGRVWRQPNLPLVPNSPWSILCLFGRQLLRTRNFQHRVLVDICQSSCPVWRARCGPW